MILKFDSVYFVFRVLSNKFSKKKILFYFFSSKSLARHLSFFCVNYQHLDKLPALRDFKSSLRALKCLWIRYFHPTDNLEKSIFIFLLLILLINHSMLKWRPFSVMWTEHEAFTSWLSHRNYWICLRCCGKPTLTLKLSKRSTSKHADSTNDCWKRRNTWRYLKWSSLFCFSIQLFIVVTQAPFGIIIFECLLVKLDFVLKFLLLL